VANTMQIKCISRTERMSPHERITHVGGYESSQWKIGLNEAIGKIERGEQASSVQAHRKTVSVIVAVSPSQTHIALAKSLRGLSRGDPNIRLSAPLPSFNTYSMAPNAYSTAPLNV
jgi:hypothetical protein